MEPRVNTATSISIHAAANPAPVLCAAVDMASSDAAPEWVHLLPAGTITTHDGRGPYRVANMQQLIANSLGANGRLVIDENHSTDLAAPAGLPAPAMGWIIALEARADGLWGKVEWTPVGERLVRRRAYRALSPVIEHNKAGVVQSLLRAGLVNRPNIKQLTALHSETDMNLLARLIAALGLDTSTSEDTLVATVTTLHQANADRSTALQAQLAPIVTAAGLQSGATTDQLVTAINALRTAPGADVVTSLQAEIATLTTSLNAERDTRRRKDAETFVDGAIKEGRAGLRPLRDHYVTRHMTDPEGVAKEVAAMPKLGGAVVPGAAPAANRDAQGKRVLTEGQELTVQRMGLDRDKYIAQLDAQDRVETTV